MVDFKNFNIIPILHRIRAHFAPGVWSADRLVYGPLIAWYMVR